MVQLLQFTNSYRRLNIQALQGCTTKDVRCRSSVAWRMEVFEEVTWNPQNVLTGQNLKHFSYFSSSTIALKSTTRLY